MADTKKFVGVLLDAESGEPVRMTNNTSVGDGVVRIYPNGTRAEPLDLWIDQLRQIFDEIEKFEEQ